MQAGTLIQALARNYTEHDNDTSYILGLDIWSQLTEYARAKIRDYFAYGDPVVRAYIRELDGSCPDMETAAFQTERDMIENHECCPYVNTFEPPQKARIYGIFRHSAFAHPLPCSLI